MRRALAGAVVLLALMTNVGARADSATYRAPYTAGEEGGDQMNFVDADPATGEMTVLRLGGYAVTETLGCEGKGGFANFVVNHIVVSDVDTVAIRASDVMLGGFTWMVATVGIAGDDGSLNSVRLRGPVVGEHTLTLPAVSPLGAKAGPGDVLEIRFGLETASSCPNVDGGHAVFESVSVS